jgi:hypothetical protein
LKNLIKLASVICLVVMVALCLGIGKAHAYIDSTVVYDIAWSGQTPNDTTTWGTPYQVNPGDPKTYDGMFEYEVRNWSTSPAAIRRFEIFFPSVFTDSVAIQGSPVGWDLAVDYGASGDLWVWGVTQSNPILPGQNLNGFLVDFSTTKPMPKEFNLAYDVYANYDKSGWGLSGKGITSPVPEPSSMMLLGMGILGLFGLKRKS